MSQSKVQISKRTMTMAIICIAGVLVAGGIWWWIRSSQLVSTEDARVKGTIVSVSSKVSGRVEQVLVQEGEHVKAGQVLAVIKKSEFEAQVAQAKGNVAAAQAKLAAAKAGNRPQEVAKAGASVLSSKASLENARKNYERAQALYQQGALSIQQRDAARTELAVVESQYASAQEGLSLTSEGTRPEDIQMLEAQVQQAQAALKNAEILLEETDIKAPVDGVVGLKSVEVGEVVVTSQPLFSVADLDNVWISANIEETYIGKVKEGQKVDFTVDAYPGEKFSGEVWEVSPATGSQFALLPSENSSGNFTKVTQRLMVKMKAVSVQPGKLKPGMSVLVNIHIQ